MCCPNCESSDIEYWIVEDETKIYTDYNDKDGLYIVRGCKCNKCNHIWYEHYTGITTDFYWTND